MENIIEITFVKKNVPVGSIHNYYTLLLGVVVHAFVIPFNGEMSSPMDLKCVLKSFERSASPNV